MSSAKSPLLVWDTSALIAAWNERYPIDVLPGFWDAFGDAIATGEMIAPYEVEGELGVRSKDLLAFLAPHSASSSPRMRLSSPRFTPF
jgi:hypothetical protein